MTLTSLTLSSNHHHLLPFSSVRHCRRHHQLRTSDTTLFAPPQHWNNNNNSSLSFVKQTTTKDTSHNNVRFLCSPPPLLAVPVSLSQRVSRFVVPRGVPVDDLFYNGGATVAVLGGAYALVSAFDALTHRNILNQDSNSTEARYFAAFVPFVNLLRLLVNGLSLASDEGLIKSVTREGDPKELLRGPLYYVLMLMLCALVFWRESPIGVVSLAMMCGGDGVADILGRRFGSMKIPYNQKKSWAGSISMLVFGFLVSIGMLYYYSVAGLMQLNWESTVTRVAVVSLVATIVESLPVTKVVDDNISVPLATMAVASFTFSH
ncbi:probable phytol kinase 1, chloroplastic isoform X2 [Arachis stenosperma]|uniref:probable phytol kinase 1, chloroplastic isoform X2 n=1 Tax=Arachis stenosperma TaxID=217475 RepID=UPI0025AD42DF|nr:probable phytol kinase 1, chloroplastic isoform X2 [Arachis stenosperma]